MIGGGSRLATIGPKASDMLLLYRSGAVRTLADAANVFTADATRA